ncbi:hypothetical protein C0Q70_19789 [Pomacea canaliculata]|uniref:Uncharacterized protein n=1 Tax=Pomacea canaliculata TaxID=400727 RepID=A0A2T7NDT3_POMCA|nr:hypothetical protein C0Q70_19789 [Pomacea canaliculata]
MRSTRRDIGSLSPTSGVDEIGKAHFKMEGWRRQVNSQERLDIGCPRRRQSFMTTEGLAAMTEAGGGWVVAAIEPASP